MGRWMNGLVWCVDRWMVDEWCTDEKMVRWVDEYLDRMIVDGWCNRWRMEVSGCMDYVPIIEWMDGRTDGRIGVVIKE